MKKLTTLLLLALSLNATAAVSSSKYNRLVNDYNNLLDDYNDLVDDANRQIRKARKDGECWTYAEATEDAIRDIQNKDASFGTYFNVQAVEDGFQSALRDRDEMRTGAIVMYLLKVVRSFEIAAMEQLGYAKLASKMAGKYLNCSNNYKNKEIIREKKEITDQLISMTEEARNILGKIYDNIYQSYSLDQEYERVIAKKETEE